MTSIQADKPRPTDTIPASRWPLIAWFISAATMSVPHAAGPVVFSLLALSVTGDTHGGAAMMLAMTLSQVIFALPVTRFGKRMPVTAFLRLLIAFRAMALIGIAILGGTGASLYWLVACAAVAGSVNGAVYGYLRAVLSQLTPTDRLPRALGISATLNELTFVLAPVAASGLGSISPVLAIVVLTAIGTIPLVLIPKVSAAPVQDVPSVKSSIFTPAIMLWLLCAVADGATMAAIEIGAVALAIHFGYEPVLAVMFTVPLCLASVTGGVFVSVRNRMASRGAVVLQLAMMSVGTGLAAMQLSVVTTIIGAILMGLVVAPLGTHYALVLETLTPADRRAETFAMLRTSTRSSARPGAC